MKDKKMTTCLKFSKLKKKRREDKRKKEGLYGTMKIKIH